MWTLEFEVSFLGKANRPLDVRGYECRTWIDFQIFKYLQTPFEGGKVLTICQPPFAR